MDSTGDNRPVAALEPREDSGDNENTIPTAAAPLPKGYVETVELKTMLLHQRKLAVEHESTGTALFKQNQLTKALVEFQSSLLNWKETLTHYRNLQEHHRFNITLLQTHQHPEQEKEREKDQAVQHDLRLTLLSESSCHVKIGCVLYKQDNLTGALQHYQTAALLRQGLGASHSMDYLSSMIRSISNQLSREEQRQQEKQLAERQQEQQQELAEQRQHLDALLGVAMSRFQAGYALYQQGQFVLAMEEYKQAAKICQQQQLYHSPQAVALLNLIDSLCCGNSREDVGTLKVPAWAASSTPSEEAQPSRQEATIPVHLRLPRPSHDNTDTDLAASTKEAPKGHDMPFGVEWNVNAQPLENQHDTCLDQKPSALAALSTESTGHPSVPTHHHFDINTALPLKKRRATLDVSQLKCSPSLLEAIKSEQARKARQEDDDAPEPC